MTTPSLTSGISSQVLLQPPPAQTMAEKQGSEDIKLEEESVSSQNLNIEPEEERRLVRKLDGRILVIASLLYLFAYLDRSNIGNARLLGLPADTLHGDPTGKLFDWVNSVFFFAYILCQVPASVASKLFPPRFWMACVAFGWGLSSTLMATAFDFGGLMTGRVFLGVFEAGFGPVIPLYFLPLAERQMAYWFGFAAVAGAFGGLIAFGVQHAHAAISGWRILLIIEGVPALLMGLVAILFLPNRPETTTFFNERERAIALDRMNRGTSGDTGAKVQKAHILMALRDWRCYAGGAIYFGLNCALASISAFLPTIIATFGNSNAITQLLTGKLNHPLISYFRLTYRNLLSPAVCCCSHTSAFFLVVFGQTPKSWSLHVHCMRHLWHWLRVRFPTHISNQSPDQLGHGRLLLAVPTNVHVRYFAVHCIVGGTYTTIGLIIAWFAYNLGSETKRATGIPLFMSIGQCGSVLGSHIFPLTEGPRYIKGFGISCALAFLAAILSMVLSISYRRDNARRDRLYGKPNARGRVDTAELADKANDFRYVI
ncbi:MFS general substrate transporter [Mycena sanguinolenta]|uniref:MFS general substrate transporter n=1 Tax=Mycena sanguinolenta TaxID=230812 RepID=A0A8H6Y294_9AGAR|nr:MFS general substrate transporter [Mycena sanguinolenta]